MFDLYEIVQQYSGLGHHRTASDVDHATVSWLESQLKTAGAETVRHSFSFDKFTCEVSGTGAARGLDLDALYYSAAGAFQVADALVSQLSFDASHSDRHLQAALEEAKQEAADRGKDGIIFATGPEASELCQINRAPLQPGKMPVCLAAGNALEALCAAPSGFSFIADVKTATSDNLIAKFGEGLPLVITTPISGWFTCAGERGTGIAIALTVAEELFKQTPVLLIMTSGHELGYLGAARFLETFDEPVRSVLHIGSCVADLGAHGPDGKLVSVTNLTGRRFEAASASLAVEQIQLTAAKEPANPQWWFGESELWAPKEFPMISIAGTSPNFHTQADTATNATTPELLERMKGCVLETAQALVL